MAAYGSLVKGAAKRRAVYERYGYRCAGCGKQFTPRPDSDGGRCPIDLEYRDKHGKYRLSMLEIDHIVPRYHGGGNDIDNLQPLCTQCNARKGHRLSTSAAWAMSDAT